MRKQNIGRILWVTSLFLLLITILFMVMDYKINYQYLEEKALYFYECDGTLCVSTAQEEKNLIYSKYSCGENECPTYQKNLDDNYVLLSEKNNSNLILWNYRQGKKVSNQYESYYLLDTNHFIVSKNKKQGIIDQDNKIIVPLLFDEIGISENNLITGYNFENIIIKKDKKYGIISYQTGKFIENLEYDESSLNTLIEKLKSKEEIN